MTTQQLTKFSQLEKLTWHWQGHKIQYTVMGSGRPLLLLHGFGGSDKPPLNYKLELWQDLVKDFHTSHIQEPTIFVGNSIGALLSLMVVANHPEIAAGAVLINCAGGLNHRPDELNLPLRFVMGTFTKLVSSPTFGPFIFDMIRRKQRIRNTLKQVYINADAVTDELVEMLYQPSCDVGAQKVFASILTAPPGPSPVELLPKVQHPLLVLWGEKDPWTPIKGAGIYQKFSENGQTLKFIPIPNTGHCPHDEKPEVVNQLMLDWLASLK